MVVKTCQTSIYNFLSKNLFNIQVLYGIGGGYIGWLAWRYYFTGKNAARAYDLFSPETWQARAHANKRLNKNQKMANKDFIDIDGIRVNDKGGWWLLRASNTQPAIVVRCESSTIEGLSIQKEKRNKL